MYEIYFQSFYKVTAVQVLSFNIWTSSTVQKFKMLDTSLERGLN